MEAITLWGFQEWTPSLPWWHLFPGILAPSWNSAVETCAKLNSHNHSRKYRPVPKDKV